MFPVNDINTARFVGISDTITLVCFVNHFWPESGANKLSTVFIAGSFRQVFEHLSDSSSVLRVQVGIDFIKEIEWRWITALNGKNKTERA
jgi:hypothetical protein